jgi:DNA-binding NarL/FixJ family response regulator
LEIGPVERLPDADTVHHPYGGLEYTPREVLLVLTSRVNGPITVAIVDDYDVVMMGLAKCSISTATAWLSPSSTRNEALVDTVDIALYDSFAQPESDHEEAQPESDHEEIAVLVANPRARRVVVYTWNFHPDLIHSARQQGAHGYLSKTLPARELVTAREAVHAGETIISEVPPRAQCRRTRLAQQGRRAQRSRVEDVGPHHAGQEQCGSPLVMDQLPIAGCVQPGTREGSCASIGAMDAPSAGFKTVGVVQQKRATLRRP